MGKSKEEDKIEKIIRGLLKLPENRRCINCNSLGPQYVCTTFWTFVCTNCSGVHREFTHRVKSVSMAKFSMEEVNALQEGGNEKARQIYFKTWDPQRDRLPDSSNIHRIRDFIKHVYFNRWFTGETHPDFSPRSQNSGLYDPYERRRGDSGDNSTFRSFDRYSRYPYDEMRSPRHSRENSRYGGNAVSPSRFDSIYSSSYQADDPRENSRYPNLRMSSSVHEGRDGRFRVEDFRETPRYGTSRSNSSRSDGSMGRYEVDNSRVAGRATNQMFTTEDIKPKMRSPDRKRSTDMDSPTIYDVKEILGENSVALRVANCPKFVDRFNRPSSYAQEADRRKEFHRDKDHNRTSHRRTVSASTQDNAESGSQSSFSNAEMKTKSGSAGSLITLEDAPPQSDKPVQKPDSQTEQTNVDSKPLEQTNDDSKPSEKEKSGNDPPKNTLEFLLFELSAPAENTSSDHSGIPFDNTAASTPSTKEPSTLEMLPALPSGSGDSSHVAKVHESTDERTTSAATATTSNASLTDANTVKAATCDTVPDLLGDDSMLPTVEGGRTQNSSAQHIAHSDTSVSDRSSTTTQTSPLQQGVNNQPTTPYQAPSSQPQPDLAPTRETSSSIETQPSRSDPGVGGRKELPADLFAFPYQPSSMPVPGWQTNPNFGMGFNMPYYPPQMQLAPYPNVAKSTNPFDTNDDTTQSHFNKGLTNTFTPPGMSNATYFGSHLPGPHAYPPNVQHQLPFASAGSLQGASVGQFYHQRPTSTQGAGGFVGGELGSTLPLQSNQQILPYRFPAPTDHSSSPSGGGNPFG